MITRYLIPILVFIPAAFFEIAVLPWAAINNAIPHITVIILVLYAHSRGQVYATVLGFVYGLLFDLISGGLLGLGMFSFTAAGFLAGYFYNENNIAFYDEPHFYILSVFISTSVFSLFYSIASLGDISYNFWILIIEHTLLPAAYTSAVAFLLLIFRRVKHFR